MHIEVRDFNGASEYFAGPGRNRWAEIEQVTWALRPQLQASDQAGKVGNPIFDPKGTNAWLTELAADCGWEKVPVPADLLAFGKDWDAGKGSVLAEWQFSNYPFLWNNIIRSEAVYQSGAVLPELTGPVEALIIVTKSGSFPASNSTLYFEQAEAQIGTVTSLGVFSIPIRLVGLTFPPGQSFIEADWNTYSGRYSRVATTQEWVFDVSWGRAAQYGNRPATITPR